MQRNLNNTPCVSGENLSGYIDGMLDGDTLRSVDEHVRQCLDCRVELDKLSATKDALYALKATAPIAPDAFWADTYRKARLSVPPSTTSVARNRQFRPWGLAAGTAGVAALLLIGLVNNSPIAPVQPTATLQDSVDVASFVSAHADYVAGKQLVDGSNNRIIRSDMASRSAGYGIAAAVDPNDPEAVSDALSD